MSNIIAISVANDLAVACVVMTMKRREAGGSLRKIREIARGICGLLPNVLAISKISFSCHRDKRKMRQQRIIC